VLSCPLLTCSDTARNAIFGIKLQSCFMNIATVQCERLLQQVRRYMSFAICIDVAILCLLEFKPIITVSSFPS
jgi:hypothetical protein